MTKAKCYAYDKWVNVNHDDSFWASLNGVGGCKQSLLAQQWHVTHADVNQWLVQPPSNITYANSAASAAYSIVWYQAAMTAQTTVNSFHYNMTNYVVGAEETEAQRLERVAKEAAIAAKREVAKVRAEKLLFTILTPSQVRQYSDDGYFEQEIGGRIYRLHANSRSGNVVLLGPDGKPTAKYCAHPTDAHETPIPDVLLSQLLMLQTDEKRFLQIANRTALQ